MNPGSPQTIWGNWTHDQSNPRQHPIILSYSFWASLRNFKRPVIIVSTFSEAQRFHPTAWAVQLHTERLNPKVSLFIWTPSLCFQKLFCICLNHQITASAFFLSCLHSSVGMLNCRVYFFKSFNPSSSQTKSCSVTVWAIKSEIQTLQLKAFHSLLWPLKAKDI